MIVGMDFGTTNSGMSFYDGEALQLIPLDPASSNPRVARTALYITNQRRVYMGREAIETYYAQNINRKVKYQRVWVGEIVLTFAELPEFVTDVTVEKDTLAPGRLFLSFKTGLRSPTYLGTMVGPQFYLLEDIVALYLYAARLRAQEHLGADLKRIVLGRPVQFSNDAQQDKLAEQRLIHAAFQAGYEEVYLQYEPIAAAYFYETTLTRPQNALIFDFGGGTLDITVARLGAPGERAILATGGVPVAGDVFDQRLVRRSLPRHFGEGSHFRGDHKERLPVPANFFEAFADWQEMLELNRPDLLGILERIERTADERRRIGMLLSLIRSSYSLKMVDAAEATKRDLSERMISMITLDGPGFSVREPVTRDGFELLIKAETQLIADEIDAVMRRAGLRDDAIDAVIRTGGSAQIPVFIRLLQERFGAEKAQSIDTFSSVASGLGVIAHYLDAGDIVLRGYRRDEWTYGASIRQHDRPMVDLDLMKKFIDVEERNAPGANQETFIVAVSGDGRVRCAAGDASGKTRLGSEDLVAFGAADDRALLITSEYRFFARTLQDLIDLAEVGMSFAEMESLRADRFGSETVTALIAWDSIAGADRLALVSDKGEAKVMPAGALIENLSPTHPYSLERISGDPVTLVPIDDAELILVTNGGSVARLRSDALRFGAQRVTRLRKDELIVGAFSVWGPVELLLTAANGRGKRIHTRAIPISDGSGLPVKTVTGHGVRACAVLNSTAILQAITTRRLLPLDLDAIPLDAPTPAKARALLRLKQDESLIALAH